MSEAHHWRWQEGQVDRHRDHLAISHDALDVPVAIVGRPEDHVFQVEFVGVQDATDQAVVNAHEATRRELDFYLVELGEPDPWAYAIYHCGTLSNVYSSVHWSWHPVAPPSEGTLVEGTA